EASVERLGLFYITGFEIRPATGRVPVVCDSIRPPFLQETESVMAGFCVIRGDICYGSKA
ncbi:hypothetical protein KCN56_21765, partial [Photobacterium galatheae]|uniref:hypothetical protein n=1 Tax=Photobacterium galatheae TaxID=1654360 RepID=UPI00202CB2F6